MLGKRFLYFDKSLKKLRSKYISDKNLILIISLLVGISSSILAILLKFFTHFIQVIVASREEYFNYNLRYFLLPFIGILLTYIIRKYIVRKNIGHGIPGVLYSISKEKSVMKKHQIIGALITSPFTVGFGGSVGLEGPSVSTGSALGSYIACIFRLSFKARTLILACGAAGAMSAIFKVPIAAIIFTIEVFSIDLTLKSLIPLIISSCAAIIVSYLFTGQTLTLEFIKTTDFALNAIPYYLILAIICAIVSIHFTKISHYVENFFKNKIKNIFLKILFGTLPLGVIIFMFNANYGEGYIFTNAFLNNNVDIIKNSGSIFYDYLSNDVYFILFLILVLYTKMFAVNLTFAAGGVGGIFAPSLFMGSLLGFIFAKSLNILGISVSISNFALVGMAGLMAGILHAPLTAIFLIAETTGGYNLIAPLMMVSAISYLVTKVFIKNSLYTDALDKQGLLITHDKDKGVLITLDIKSIIENNFLPVNRNMSLRDLIRIIPSTKRNIFPVLTKDGNIEGELLIEDIRSVVFDESKYDNLFVADLMRKNMEVINLNEDSPEKIMRKFKYTEAWNIPVIEDSKYIGFISRSRLFTLYREELIKNFI